MREWIKRGGGERKEGWNGVKRFSFFVIMIYEFQALVQSFCFYLTSISYCVCICDTFNILEINEKLQVYTTWVFVL